jgi:hypothetical protein
VLGTVLGVAANHGRDKITIIASPGVSDLGAWLEQLIAESTGKVGKGIIPVDREKLAKPTTYGNDRVFAYLRLAAKPNKAQDAAVAAIEKLAPSRAYHAEMSTHSDRNFSAGKLPPRSPAQLSVLMHSTSRTSKPAKSKPKTHQRIRHPRQSAARASLLSLQGSQAVCRRKKQRSSLRWKVARRRS